MKPTDNLMALLAACRVHFTWFGTRKTLTAEQKNEAAEPFGAAGSVLSASKRLLNTRHRAYRAVTSVRNEARLYWKRNTLPWPEPGIRLLRRSQVGEFQAKMLEFRGELVSAVAELNTEYPSLRETAREQLGELFNDSDYPPTLAGAFAIDWEFPSVEPPPYLKTLNPALYEQETARLAARFEEAMRLTEQAFAEELSKLVSHLSERVTDGPDGRKSFRASTLTNLSEFFDRFKNLNVGSNSELDKLVNQAKAALEGVDAKDIRKSEEIRAELAKQMATIKQEIDEQLITVPKRRIIGIAPEVETNAA
jgi:hypothetical protein